MIAVWRPSPSANLRETPPQSFREFSRQDVLRWSHATASPLSRSSRLMRSHSRNGSSRSPRISPGRWLWLIQRWMVKDCGARSGDGPGPLPGAAPIAHRRHLHSVCAGATVATRLTRLIRGWVSPAGQHSRQGGLDRWQSLSHPVPGHSTIDGLPVAVVAVRRRDDSGQLEVIRGYHPTPAWPGSVAPPGAQRHLVPASSFNPHPRREISIGDQRFGYNTVAGSACCNSCGKGGIGFGFVSADSSLPSAERSPAIHQILCELCAEKQAGVAVL